MTLTKQSKATPSIPDKGYATMPERMEIYKLVNGDNAVCSKGDDGLAHYNIGWDDKRVASEAVRNLYGCYSEVRAAMIKSAAASSRLQWVGKLKPNSNSTGTSKTLTARVAAIESQYAVLKVQIDKMSDTIASMQESISNLDDWIYRRLNHPSLTD